MSVPEFQAAPEQTVDPAAGIFHDRIPKGLNWPTVIALIFLHAGAIAALFMFSWTNLWVSVFLYWMTIGLGISMGYHRLHTHRGYKCPLWLEYGLAFLGALTLEGGPIFWVAAHRVHHQKSDHKGDPHSPKDGFFWAHMGWILVGRSKHARTELLGKYAPDLAKHRFYRELNTWHWVPLVLLGVILYAIGGLSLMLWGTCVRVVVGLHSTWLVNSATHMWGGRRFATRDDSRNNWWVAALTFGEGWHNNHHAHPTSIRHGLAWYEVDHSWIMANIWKKMGLIWDLKVAKIDTKLPAEETAA
jgi:stearoyl-CoA desaturase (delta-9 desaturase)